MNLLANAISEAWVQRLGWVLLHFLWQGTVIALVLAVLLHLLTKASSHARYALAGIALLVCAVTPVITWTMLALHERAPFSMTETVPANLQQPQDDISQKGVSSPPIEVPNRLETPVETETPWQVRLVQAANASLPYAVSLWFLGVVILSTRLTLAWIWTVRLCRSSIPANNPLCLEKFERLLARMRITQPVRLLESALVEVPTLIGWLRPTILIPVSLFAGMTPDQLEAIFAHELAHVRRYDYLVNLFQTVIETILFYHPAIWWISRKLREERENCCDDIALEVMSDRFVYASALAQLEEGRATYLALSATGGSLLQRMKRIAGVKDRKASAWPLWLLIVGVLSAACLTQLQAGENAPQTAADYILRLGRFVDGVNSMDYSEIKGDPKGQHSSTRWQEMGDYQRVDLFTSESFSSEGKSLGSFHDILSYDGDYGYMYKPGDDRIFRQKKPFLDLTEGYSAGIFGPLLPFEFLDKKGERSSSGKVTLKTLKSPDALAAAAKRATLVPDKNRIWEGHPCIAVKVSDGNDHWDSQASVDFVAYFAKDLDYYPVAFEVYKQGKLTWYYSVVRFASIPLANGKVFRYPGLARGFYCEGEMVRTSSGKGYAWEMTSVSDLRLNTLSKADFTPIPPVGSYIEDRDAQKLIKVTPGSAGKGANTFSPGAAIPVVTSASFTPAPGVDAAADSSAQKQSGLPVAMPLSPQEVLIQAIAGNDPTLAAKAVKDGAQLNLETEYLHQGIIDRNAPLYFAAEKGELEIVRLLVEHGAGAQPGRSTWTNPLDAALRNGFPSVATYLHEHGATSDPVVYAAGTGDMNGLAKLLAAASPKTLDEAARAAAGCGQAPALAALIEKGANVPKAFQRAASTGNLESMRYLLSHGVDLNTAGYDALCHAANNSQSEATAFLLKAGVSPNRQKQPTDTRFTEINPPLNQAACSGAVGVVKLLLEAGANPDSVIVTEPGMGNAGNTALCDACESDNTEIVQLLLDHGAGLETMTSGGFTPALYAAYVHAPKCLALLLDRGANIKAVNSNQNWKCGIVDFAAIFTGEDANRQAPEMPTTNRLNRSMATVQVLLDHGMDLNSTTNEGASLLTVAIVNGQTAWTEALLKRGARVNTVDQQGGTPLIRSIMTMAQVKDQRYYAVLDELLARGADPNLGNDNPIAVKDAFPSAFKAAICGFGSDEMKRKTINILLAHGAHFSVPKGSAAEKMLLAATAGNAGGVAQLLKSGASPNVADSKGWTPLLSSAALGYGTILKMLVDAGADVNAHDVMGLNALWFTSQRYPDLTDFHLLLDKGADVNADSNFMFYDPVVYEAIQRSDPAFLSDLLKHGASPNMLPGDHPNRFEPLELAVTQLMQNFADQKRRDVVTMLIAAGANRNPRQVGFTGSLLYFPVANNKVEMVKFLLDAGIDPKKDADGGKAISDELERHGSKEMKALLGPALAKT